MDSVIQYPALIDVAEGAYGVVFPDIPGIAAIGDTVDEALLNAQEALLDYAIEAERDDDKLEVPSPLQSVEVPTGNHLVSIPLMWPRTKVLVPD